MAPSSRSAGSTLDARGGSQDQTATTTPRNDTAFTRKAGPTPHTATTTPPSAGPTARAALKPVELSRIAAERSSS